VNQVKVSEIRAKFPMYGDKTDEELLMAVRKKFYPEMPVAEFVKRVEFDTQRERLGNEQTNEMGFLGRLNAGAGSGLMDVLRGVGQAVGAVSRDDVAEARKLDAPLKSTTAGAVGNVAGQVAAFLPTAAIPGANTLAGAGIIGAGTGALAPSVSDDETLRNTGLGAAAGPLSVLFGRGLAASAKGLQGLLQPLTSKGQERVAASTLQSFAKDPKAAALALKNAKELVPGSSPTLAQASGDPGLAQLERTLVNNPETGPILASRFADQRAARLGAIQNVAGTDDYYNAIKSGRQIFAQEDYSKAIAEGIDPEMAKALKPQIDSLMSRPSIQQAKAEAIRLAKESDQTISNFGSIEGLDWLKKGLDNIISKASAPGSSIGDAKLRAVVQTKQDLMSVIEQVAPAYKVANDNFAKMSRQVNSMDVARDVLKRYEPALSRYGAGTRELGSAYASALEGAKESVKKQTGLNLPMSKVMDTQDISALENVARDLARKAASEDMGRAVGSNTAQNLSAQNLLRRALGPAGLPQSWSESTALQTLLAPVTATYRVGGAEKRIMDRLSQAALDPKDAAALLALEQQAPGTIAKLLKRSEAYLPGASAGLLTTR
jgi:hypothetical protein